MKKPLKALAASSLLGFLALSPAYAESIPTQGIQQLNNSAEPDVDPGASKGPDKPVFVLERMQINHSTEVDVPSRAEKGGNSLPSSSRKLSSKRSFLKGLDRPGWWLLDPIERHNLDSACRTIAITTARR